MTANAALHATFLTVCSIASVCSSADSPEVRSGVDRIGFGIIGAQTAELRKSGTMTLPKRDGLYVGGVLPYSCGAASKLEPFDVIVAVNGKAIETVEDWKAAREHINSGDKVIMDVLPAKAGKKISWGVQKRIVVIAKTVGEDAIAAVRKKHDAVEGDTWIFHRDNPNSAESGDDLSLYFRQTGPTADSLHLRLVYAAKEWLFVKSMVLSDGGKVKKEFDLRSEKWNRDIKSSGVWEWCDVSATKAICDPLREAILRPQVTLRYEGQTHVHDRTLTPAERARMLTMLDAFKALGGKID